MIKMETVAELLNNACESMIVVFFVYNIFKTQYKYGKIGLLLLNFVVMIIISVMTFLSASPKINLLTTFLTVLFISTVWFKVKVKLRLFYSTMFLVIVLAAEFIPMAVLYLFDFGTPLEQLSSGRGRYIGMIVSKIFLFWLSVYVIEYLKNKTRDVPLKNWVAIILMPFLSIMIIYSMFTSSGVQAKETIVYIVAIGGLLALNLFVFDFFSVYANQFKMVLMEQQLKNDEKNYKLIEDKYNEIQNLKHDFKNQLAVTNDMFRKGKTDEAIKHLSGIQKQLSYTSGVCYTGISSIDSIVNLKWQKARELGIEYVTQVSVTEKMDLNNLLLCRIFANLIDNAIEGCERYEGEGKFISIKISQLNGNLHIGISNSSNQIDVNDLRTEKSDSSSHGFGISSIKKAVEELNGIVTFKCKCEIFCVDILIKY